MGGMTKEYLLKRSGCFCSPFGWERPSSLSSRAWRPVIHHGDAQPDDGSERTVENSDEIIAAWRAVRAGRAVARPVLPLSAQHGHIRSRLLTGLFPAQVEDMAARTMPWTSGCISWPR